MRISATLIITIIASLGFIHSQNTSGGTKIDDAERKRLENQFKGLKNYYITDDGLVVYQPQAQESATPNKPIESNSNTQQTGNSQQTGSPFVTKNNSTNPSQPANSQSAPSNQNVQTGYSTNEPIRSSASSTNNGFIVKKAAVDPSNIGNTPITTTPVINTGVSQSYTPQNPVTSQRTVSDNQATVMSSVPVPISSLPRPSDSNNINEKPGNTQIQQKAPVDTRAITIKTEEPKKETVKPEEKQPVKQTKSTSKKDIFKQKPQSTYSSFEEAAETTQSILEKLQNQMNKSKSSGSMASRIAGGAKKPLKKEALDPTLIDQMTITQSTQVGSQNIEQTRVSIIEENEFGDEPTYYINGIEASKEEVDKLRAKDILRRLIKNRNTVSGNPNGEVWIDTY